jgi:hypothetical protein
VETLQGFVEQFTYLGISARAVKGALFSPVQVRPGELSVHPSSYRDGKEGNRAAEALGTMAHRGWVRKPTGRNTCEAWASLESDVVRADPL